MSSHRSSSGSRSSGGYRTPEQTGVSVPPGAFHRTQRARVRHNLPGGSLQQTTTVEQIIFDVDEEPTAQRSPYPSSSGSLRETTRISDLQCRGLLGNGLRCTKIIRSPTQPLCELCATLEQDYLYARQISETINRSEEAPAPRRPFIPGEWPAGDDPYRNRHAPAVHNHSGHISLDANALLPTIFLVLAFFFFVGMCSS